MDDLEIFTAEQCPQNSDEWYQARAGIVTASNFKTVMAKGRGGGESETRRKLIYNTASEIVTGKPTPAWEGNQHTRRGHVMEASIRDLYQAANDCDLVQIGFIRRGRIGCSPDSLIGDNGLFEAKSMLPHILLPLLEAGVLPSEHRAQVQGQLLVSRRDWCDYRAYWPGLPQLCVRVYRDLPYLSTLQSEIEQFNHEVDRKVAWLRERMA